MKIVIIILIGLVPYLCNGQTNSAIEGRKSAAVPSSLNANANDAKNDSSEGASKNNAAGGMLMGVGGAMTAAGAAMMASPTTAPMGQAMVAAGIAQMVMGALAFAQGGADSAKAKDAANTAMLSDNLGYNNSPTATDQWGYTPEYWNNADYKKNLEGISKLESLGYQINPKTGVVTTPDGKTVTEKDFTTKSGLAGLGVSEALQNKVQANLLKAAAYGEQEAEKMMGLQKDRPNVVAVGTEDGGGGGMGFGGGGNSVPSGVSQLGGNAFGSGSGKRAPASVAGMSVNFGNDKIGVSADNIFKMVERRYQLKDKQDAFIK